MWIISTSDNPESSTSRRRLGKALKLDWKYPLMLYLAVLMLVPVELYKIQSGLPIDIQLDRIVAFTIFSVWLAALLVDPKTRLMKSPVNYAVYIFAGVVFLSFALNMQELSDSFRYIDAVKRLFYIAAMALLFFFVISTIKTRAQVDSVIRFGIFVAVVISIFSLIEFLTEFNIFRHLHEVFPFLTPSMSKLGSVMFRGGYIRVTGPADHPIALGVLLSVFMPFAFHYFEFAEKRLEKFKYGFALAAIFLATLLTVSRTPVVAIVAMSAVYIFYKPSNVIRFGIVLFVVAFVVHMAFPGVLGALKSFFSLSHLESREVLNPHGRLADHPKMISLFLEKPIYGRGYGWWDNARMFYVDNQYLKVMVELGAMGVVAISWLMYKANREIWGAAASASPRDRDLLVSIVASCVAYISTLLTYDSFGFAQVTYLFFIIMALGISLAAYVKKQSSVTTSA